MTYSRIQVTPYAGTLGAEVSGVSLSAPLDDELVAEIRAAWLENLVLIFRDQDITPDDHVGFAQRIANEMEYLPFMQTLEGYDDIQVAQTRPDRRPERFVDWHYDVTFKPVPTLGAVLHCIEMPEGAGDTMFVNMCAAYEALSEPMQTFIGGLTGIHDAFKGHHEEMIEAQGAKAYAAARENLPLVEHPLVTEHPETGRPVLYANPLFMTRIKELEEPESDMLIAFLFRHCESPEFQCRLRWRPNTVAMFDNRCTMHKVLNDYWPRMRKMHRIGLEADEPPRAASGN